MDKAWNTSKAKQMLQDQLKNSLQVAGRILQQISNKVKVWLTEIALIFTIIGAISLVEIARSKGFHWRSHIDFWNSSKSRSENIGNWVAMFMNFFGSLLAISLVLGVVVGLPTYFIWKNTRKDS